ncbi:MAG: YbgA family protein, partial [Candidatus Omnitrophica bacterium]|nr:YbgA family protein [Candidatus Omnitrophota bacterium]
LKDYENNLKEAFKRNAKYVFHINVLMHALGYFKTVLTSKEKQHFLKLLERYRHGLIPLSAVISIMQSWIIKYEVDYLFHQVYFAPYPEALLEITDSGKGRDGK